MNILLVGDHLNLPGYEVVETCNIQFPANVVGCRDIIEGLLYPEDISRRYPIVFQAIPGQVAVAISRILVQWEYRATMGMWSDTMRPIIGIVSNGSKIEWF